jgi:hypothetical protein
MRRVQSQGASIQEESSARKAADLSGLVGVRKTVALVIDATAQEHQPRVLAEREWTWPVDRGMDLAERVRLVEIVLDNLVV